MITEPLFYAVAVPAVLMMGMSKSGFGAGFGALAVPLMSLAIPVPQAAAIMLPLLAVMDGLGFMALVKHADRGLLKLLLPVGLLGTLLGTALFSVLSAGTVAAVVGVLTLLFVAQRLIWPPSPAAVQPPRWLGAVLGLASGFTSFVSHAGGPPIMAYVLPLRLPPLTFSATMAVFFTAINLSKWIPYAFLGLIDLRNMSTSLVLLPLAPIGVWAGLKLMRRVSQQLFYRLVTIGMTLTGVVLIWRGLS
ncbi:MAG: sulfite exporter TauE/SafE family protein [Burkholderiaceae bacterium]|nr:sulfite exporter TauE/SafE family protein [Burkholderiaceae bacterium]